MMHTWCVRNIDGDLDEFARIQAMKMRISLSAYVRILILREMNKEASK